MNLKTKKSDRTRNERQARRREREKKWLSENGWRSWEALHTAILNGTASLMFMNRETTDQVDTQSVKQKRPSAKIVS